MTIIFVTPLGVAENRTCLSALRAVLPGEVLIDANDGSRSAAGDALVDIAIVANPLPGSLAGLGGLKLIQSMWAGVEGLMADESLPAGVPIARMVDPAMNQAMAETALWAALSLHRDHFRYAQQQREGAWKVWPQRRADEVTVAVLGLGQMGRGAALALRAAGYRVIGWSARPAQIEGVACRAAMAALPEVLGEAQIIINLLPLTSATRGLFDARCFGLMQRGVGFVNLARGAHVVEPDLLAALDDGQVGHAVLDVFAVEPLPAAHAFWSHPRVTLLPHAAAQTDERSAALVVAANVRALREGRPLANLVDRTRGY